MPSKIASYWLPRMLFRLTLLLAATLGVALIAAPWVVPLVEAPPPVLEVLARDVVVQRTGIACTLGMTVAAFVFFRPVPATSSSISESVVVSSKASESPSGGSSE